MWSSASPRGLSQGVGSLLTLLPHRLGLHGWRLWKHLCASGVVIYQPLKTLYKLLSEITQEDWLWYTTPHLVQWTP